MKRHSSLIPLSHDHHQALLLAQVLRQDVAPYKGMPQTLAEVRQYAVSEFATHIAPHFDLEEQVIFPNAEAAGNALTIIVNELRQEHREIRAKFSAMQASAVSAEFMHELGLKMKEHVRKEERVLFMQMQEILPENELQKLEEQVQAFRTEKGM